ncbi:MAG: polymerase sigma factor [Verrucomicrobia bacterium]|nr:polymerase sigma factor [Verrucomicrobiota bacterium]
MASDVPHPPESASAAGFATTEWSVVLAAGSDVASQRAAIERLCRIYWNPIYCFIRRSGHDPELAKDLTQSFFAQLIAGDFFASADPARGRFRGFLRQTCRHFLGNEWQKRAAEKRGGQAQWVPWSELSPADEKQFEQPTDPSRAYDRQWALSLLRNALSRLEQESKAGDPKIFDRLHPYLTARPGPGEYERLARELGIARGTVPVLVHRLTKRYQELIRAEVARTVATRAEIDDELRDCLAALSD